MKNMEIIIEKANPIPVYKQIKEQIKKYIIENDIKEGTLLPDIRTISSIAGVSLKTTERALNELIKEKICFRRPKKGTFVGKFPNVIQKKKICGIYHAKEFKSFENDLIQASIYRGILKQAHKKGMDTIFITGDVRKKLSFYLENNTEFDFKGIIMLDCEELTKGKILAEEFPNIKFIYLHYFIDGFEDMPSNIYGVFNDDYAGAYQMTEYLIDKGHRKIAIFSTGLKNENYRQRIKGYKQALKDNRIKFSKTFVRIMEKEKEINLRDIGRSLTEDLIKSGKMPTAIFCVNDLIAAGVIEYLKEIGLDKKIEVTGYDNVVKYISKDYNFSTIEINFEKMGIKAIDILTNKKCNYPKVLRITPQMLIRN